MEHLINMKKCWLKNEADTGKYKRRSTRSEMMPDGGGLGTRALEGPITDFPHLPSTPPADSPGLNFLKHLFSSDHFSPS